MSYTQYSPVKPDKSQVGGLNRWWIVGHPDNAPERRKGTGYTLTVQVGYILQHGALEVLALPSISVSKSVLSPIYKKDF